MKADPTNTITLRRKAAAEVDARFNRLKRAIRSAFKDGGLKTNIERARQGRFDDLLDQVKVDEFNRYFHDQVELEILRQDNLSYIEKGKEDHWLNKHIGEGYRRGAIKMRFAAERMMPNLLKLPDYSPFSNPQHVQRAELIFKKAYSDLEGVTQVMEKQMSRILADGILRGHSVKKVAKEMESRVDKIGKTRAKLIARTEIIESHSSSAIMEADLLEQQTGVTIKMKWISAGDSRVRPEHIDRDGQVYTRAEASNLIGEPNCRCALSAVFDL
jgi:SPP1 gp7 family putative phage head morphogenesis protein